MLGFGLTLFTGFSAGHSLVNIYADLELMASIMPTLTDVNFMAIFLGENPPFGGLKQQFGMGHPAMAKDQYDLQVFDGRPWPTSHERCRRPGTQDDGWVQMYIHVFFPTDQWKMNLYVYIYTRIHVIIICVYIYIDTRSRKISVALSSYT